MREPTRPEDLAQQLGITGLRLRNFLRAAYPRPEALRGTSWILTSDQVAAARAYFGERASSSASQPSRAHGDGAPLGSVPTDPDVVHDWFWEGNVQIALVRFLRREG